MKSRRSKRNWIPYLVLVGTLFLTVMVTYQITILAAAQDRLRFQNSVSDIASSIEKRMETYLSLLHGTGGLFAASDYVSRDEFHTYVSHLKLRESYPGIQGIGFSILVPPAEKAKLEATMRKLGYDDFKIVPEGERSEYHAIIYLEPLDWRNRAAIGYDMFTERTRRIAMERARAEGVPIASGKVELVQEIDDNKQAGFLIYLPVYRGKTIPATEAERKAAFIGFAYSPFRADDLLRGILGNNTSNVDFEVYEGSVAPQNLLHNSNPAANAQSFQPLLTTQKSIQIAGSTWLLNFRTRPEFAASSNRGMVPYVLFGGLFISVTLFALMLAQTRAHTAVEQIAAQLTESRSELIESEERYRTTTETASDAILTIDSSSRILFVNHATQRIFGYTAPELLNQPLTMLMPEYLRHVHQAALDQYVKTGQRHISWQNVEVPGLHKDGREIPLELSFGEFIKGDQHYFTGVIRDISERKQAEAALLAAHDELEKRVDERTEELAAANRTLQSLNQELERSNRELQDFAFVASHDLQEPLRKIQAFGDLLKGNYGESLGNEGNDFLERMQRAAQRMHRLINDLLTFSRVTTKAQPFLPVDLNEVMEEVLEDLEARVRQTGAQVKTEKLPIIEADEMQMRQLLQNLIGNALKFHRPDSPPLVRIHAETTNGRDAYKPNQLCLLVEDNGIGFDEKYLDRIFTPFQRLHSRNEYEGTGMGLAVCRKIVERHDGQITARSKPGIGTTFIVTLPIKHSNGWSKE